MDFEQFIPPELRKNAKAIVNGIKYAADAMKITDTNQVNQLGKDVIKNIKAGKVMPTLSSIARYTTGMTTLAMDALPGAKFAKIPIKGAMDLGAMIEKGIVKKGVKVPENADEVLSAFDKKKLKKDQLRNVKKNRLLNIYMDKTKRKERTLARAEVVKDKELNELINKINLHRAKFGGNFKEMYNNPYSDEIVSKYAEIYNSKNPFKMEHLFSKIGDQNKRLTMKAKRKGLLDENSEEFSVALSSQKDISMMDSQAAKAENFLINFKKNNSKATTLEARRATDNYLKDLSKEQRLRIYKLLENEKTLEKLNFSDLNKGTAAKIINDSQITKYLEDFKLNHLPSDFDFVAKILNPKQKKIVSSINKDITDIIGIKVGTVKAPAAAKEILRENLNRMIRYGLRDKGQTVEEVMTLFEKQINNPKFLKKVVPLIAEKVKSQQYIAGLNKTFGVNIDAVNLSHKKAVLKDTNLTFAIQNLFIGSAKKNTAESAIQKKIKNSTDVKEIKKLKDQIKDEGLLDPISPNYPSPDTVSADAGKKIKKGISEAMMGDSTYFKKDGGVIGFDGGGSSDSTEPVEEVEEVSFVDKMKDVLFPSSFDYPYKVTNEPIDRGFIGDIAESTPEQRIAVYDIISLQGLEDKIKGFKNENRIDFKNENISPDAREYLRSRTEYSDQEFFYRQKLSVAQFCSTDSDSPFCKSGGGIFNGPALSVEEVNKNEQEYRQSSKYKILTERYFGTGQYKETSDASKKEIRMMQIKNIPANVADVVLDFYQFLSPPALVAGELKKLDEIKLGEAYEGAELISFLESQGKGFIDENKDGINDLAALYDELDIKFYAEGKEPRDPTTKEKLMATGFSVASVGTLFLRPGYVGRLTELLTRKDIGRWGKAIRVAPRLLGMPTVKEGKEMLRLIGKGAWGALKAPIKIPMKVGKGVGSTTQYVTATVKPGTENIFYVGNKTLPQLGISLPAGELAKRQGYQQIIKNVARILSDMSDDNIVEKEKISEKKYRENISREIRNPQYTEVIKVLYDDALRTQLANPEEDLGEPEDVDVLDLLSKSEKFESIPKWVVEYAKEMADEYIKISGLKTNTIGDTMFFDMMNKEAPEEMSITVPAKEMSMGGDPKEEAEILEESQNVIPAITSQNESIFDDEASYDVAQNIFGKAPGWAVAGVNKIDDLLRPGGTGTRIAQADEVADAATSAGEKINRFYSNIEARLIDPNAPSVYKTEEDLYNFLNSKGISKIEIEDYQIPQLVQSTLQQGIPLTKANLLERIKNAPVRKIESKTFGFRSEKENIDGEFTQGKFPNQYIEKGYLPETYRENVIYIDPKNLPQDINSYAYSTHGFFEDDTLKYVIGWSRSTDRYGIIPGSSNQVLSPEKTKIITDLTKKIERLTKLSETSVDDIISRSGGRLSVDQATKNISQAKKDLNKAKKDLDGANAVIKETSDEPIRVTFADEIQSDIFQKYRDELAIVKKDYETLMAKNINVKSKESLNLAIRDLDLNTRKGDEDILTFYDKHKHIMRPLFRTVDDFAAHVKSLKESNQVFADFAKIRPGTLQPSQLKTVQDAAKKRDEVLEIINESFTDPKTLLKLFPNIPFKNRKAWGETIIKNDLYMAAKRLFIDKDANAAQWYAISPADLVKVRYSSQGLNKGGTNTSLEARALAKETGEELKGVGVEEFYGGPNSTDPSGTHYTSVLEDALRRAAGINNTEFKIIKVSVGDPKSMKRFFEIISPDGEIVHTQKLGRGNNAADALMRATKYAEDLGEGFTVKAVEVPKDFKTVDAYAIKLTPEMLLPSKTHMATGGYVHYDPLVSVEELIGAY